MSTQFIEIVKSGDRAALASLLAQDPGALLAKDDDGTSAILVATYRGHHEVAQWLIEQGADLDIFGAAATGALERVNGLLAENPALALAHSPDGWTPLHLAAHFGRKNVADALLAGGAEVDALSSNDLTNTPLHAAIAGHEDAVAGLLLANGADIDAVDGQGNTALHLASHDDEPDIIKLLIIHGAEVNPRNHVGKTPLGQAAELGHSRVVDMLSAYGGDE